MANLGRIFRARQHDGTVVGELALGSLAVDMEHEVRTVLFFDWQEHEGFVRQGLARSNWAPAEVVTVATQWEAIATQVPDVLLAQQAWTDMKNPDLGVDEIAGVWASIRRFFSECAKRQLAVESNYVPVSDGMVVRWASAEE